MKKAQSRYATADGSHSDLREAILAKLAAKGWSQKELARFVRKDESTVSLWLAAQQSPRPKDERTIRLLAKFLGKTPRQVKELVLLQKERIRLIPAHQSQPDGFEAFLQSLAVLDRGVSQVPCAGLDDFGEPVPEKAVRHILWRKNGRDERTRRAVEKICKRLDDNFDGTPDGVLPRTALLSAVDEALAEHPEQIRANLAEALRRELVQLRIVSETSDGQIERRWPVGSSFVLNSLFGISLHIKGLNWLLDGGLLLPAGKEGMVTLIKGKPGTGKTMLALQLAASIAAAGHLVIYLTADQTPNLLMGQLQYAGYSERVNENGSRKLQRNDTEFVFAEDTVDTAKALEIVNTFRRGHVGALVLASAARHRGFEAIRDQLRTVFAHAIPESGRHSAYTCCFVDSIDAVTDTDQRLIYRELFSFLRRKCDIGVLISETHEENPQMALREHLVDMIFKLSYRTELESFKSRVLEIEKCRTQSVIRGEHRFSIHRGCGISIYPSVQSLLSIWRRRTRERTPLEVVNWTVDRDLDLSRVLRKDVTKGSAVLLCGPPATHKTALGLSFLAAGLQGEPNSSYLLVSLREDIASVARIIRTYPQLHVLLRGGPDSMAISPRLKILHVPPDYFTADRFLDWMRDALAEHDGGKDKPISRVLFSSLNQLLYNSPMCRQEPLLIPALIEMFKKKAITSLFLAVGDKRESEIQNIFDTIIFTQYSEDENPDSALLKVGHSGPCNADRSFYRLDRVPINGPPVTSSLVDEGLDWQFGKLVVSGPQSTPLCTRKSLTST